MYDWPANLEENWTRAEEIFRKINEQEYFDIDSRGPAFKTDIDSNHATSLCGLANTQMDIMKERCQSK